jgi:hypothetical protein
VPNEALYRGQMQVDTTHTARSWVCGRTFREDATALALLATVAVTSRLVEPKGPDAPLVFRARRLPNVCLIRRVTGRPCLSCGLTRGVIYAARFDFVNAARANALAPFVLVLVLGRAVLAMQRLLGLT